MVHSPRKSVALATALVVAAAGCGTPSSRSAAPTSTASSALAIDPCVIGSWTVTHATSNEIVNDDVVEFTSDGGAVWRLDPGGKGVKDFGRGTTYSASHGGKRISFVYNGTVTFSFTTQAVGKQLALDNLRPDGESGAEVSIGDTSVWVPIGATPDSLSYNCGDNSLELIDEVKTLEFRRS